MDFYIRETNIHPDNSILGKYYNTIKQEDIIKRNFKEPAFIIHKSRTPEYKLWCRIRQKSYKAQFNLNDNEKNNNIRVCDRWLDSFDNFLADIGPKPQGYYFLTLLDTDKPYQPGNCEWVLRKKKTS